MDASDFSGYPRVANTEYSPTIESYSYVDAFAKSSLGDFYTTSPDHSLDTFQDGESFFDHPFASVEFPAVANGTANIDTSTLNSYRTAFNPALFNQLEQGFASNFRFDLPSSFEPNLPLSPHSLRSQDNTIQNRSPTPSLCGDGPLALLASPPPSPSAIKRESPDEPTSVYEEPLPKRSQRKRGRPRLNRTLSDPPSASSVDSSSSRYRQHQRSSRLPHNQVERKYREGLNLELERLRRAVPTLPQGDEAGLVGQPKPSKAMVLAGAIEYIRKIERERDELLEENLRLGGGWGAVQRDRN